MSAKFNSLFDIYPDRIHRGAVVGFRKADGTPLEFPCTLDTGDAVRDAKGRWTASALGLKPITVRHAGSLCSMPAEEAWIGDGFRKGPYGWPINGTLESIRFVDGVTEINSYAFSWYNALKSITIPEGVAEIRAFTFSWCQRLASITIPDGVRSIGEGVFTECSDLTSITLPESVRSIGDHAFDKCRSLESVTIPGSVSEIGAWAFSRCESLTSIMIPSSVTEIGEGAFAGCISLSDIYVNLPRNGILDDARVPEGCKVHWNQTEAV